MLKRFDYTKLCFPQIFIAVTPRESRPPDIKIGFSYEHSIDQQVKLQRIRADYIDVNIYQHDNPKRVVELFEEEFWGHRNNEGNYHYYIRESAHNFLWREHGAFLTYPNNRGFFWYE